MKRHAAPLFSAVVHKDDADRRPFEPMRPAELTVFLTIGAILSALCQGVMVAAEILGGG